MRLFFAQSIKEDRRVELPAITSIATSLGARQISEHTFTLTKTHPIFSMVVSDHVAVSACLRFLDDHRVLTEPACGASLAAVYDCSPLLSQIDTVLVVVCGGVTATLGQLQEWSQRS